MRDHRPGTAPYFLTPNERDMLVDVVRRKAAKVNDAIRKSGQHTFASNGDHLVEYAEYLFKAAELRELLYALGASPTWKIASRLKGALDEIATEKLKKKILREGDNADEATAFLKVDGWLDPAITGGYIAVFLIPVEGARVRVMLTGCDKADEVLARVVEIHQLIELFESIPASVGRKFLISDRGFKSYMDWTTALEAP